MLGAGAGVRRVWAGAGPQRAAYRGLPAASARAWNSLPSSVRNAPSLMTFRRDLKTVLFRSSFDLH